MEQASVRYIVNDVDAAIGFYVGQLGFREMMHPAPGFAMLARGALRLLLSAPGATDASGAPGGGGRALSDGTLPSPGGWNRFSLQVDDVAAQAVRAWSTVWEAGSCWWRTPPATWSNSLNRSGPQPPCRAPCLAQRQVRVAFLAPLERQDGGVGDHAVVDFNGAADGLIVLP